MVEGRRDPQSWRKAVIRADALPMWSDKLKYGLVINGGYALGGGKETICAPEESTEFLNISIALDRTNDNYIAGQMNMLFIDPDVRDVTVYRKGR